MEIFLFILVGMIAVIAVYAIVIYNGLVNLKHGYKKAWANIDVILKQRHDELPKLVETCKQYMQYEQETLEQVMQARAAVASAREAENVQGVGQAEGMLRLGLGNLYAVAENYPDLKANDSFRHLQTRITGLEETISNRREFFNESVNNLNVRIEQFPDIIVARFLNFQAAELLEFSQEEKADVDMQGLFG